MTSLAYFLSHRFTGVAGLFALASVSALAACSDFGPAPQPIDDCPSCAFGDFKRGALFLSSQDSDQPITFADGALLLSGAPNTVTQAAAGNLSAEATLAYVKDKVGISECGAYDLSAELTWVKPIECRQVIVNPDGTRFVVAVGKRDIEEDRRSYCLVYGIAANGDQLWRRTVIADAGPSVRFTIQPDGLGGVTFLSAWISRNPLTQEIAAGHFDAAGNETRIAGLPEAVLYSTVRAASDGNLILLGRFSNTLALRGVAPLQATGADALYIAAVKPDGSATWAHKIDSSMGGLTFDALSVFADGRIVFAGKYEGTALTIGDTQITGGNAYIAQLNAQGQLTWSLSAAKLPTFAGFVPTATGIFAAGSANITAADGPMIFGGSQITKTDGSEAVLVYFADSRVTSIKQFGGYGEHYASSVARAATGEIFATIVVEKVGDRENDPPTVVINGTELTGAGTFVGEVAP